MRRRHLLQATAATALTLPGVRLWAGTDERAPRLLLVFLRGGYDAANVLVPHGSPFYYEARPRIAIARPGSAADAALPLDAQWGLHPALAGNVAALFGQGQAAFVPFAGTDDTSRSHFETQDRVELGTAPGDAQGYGSGFLNRLASVLGLDARGALAFTDQLPLAFRGPQVVGNQSLRSLGGARVDARQAKAIERMYAGTDLASSVHSGFEVREQVSRVMEPSAAEDVGHPPRGSARAWERPGTRAEMAGEMRAANRNAIGTRGFELEARRIGRLLRDAVQLGFVDIGGWDTHVGEGGAQGLLATRLSELGRGLAALADEAGSAWQRTVVVVVSEFGRTFRENGNRGTDHGHGTVYWVLGGALRGGRVLGEQQALSAGTLFQDRDYPVLNEYRALLGGVFQRLWGLDRAQLARVFPGVTPRDLGLV